MTGETRWTIRWLRSMAPLLVLVILSLAIGLKERSFFTPGNLANVVTRNVPLALIAVGETMVIIAGHIDLSVGSVMALSAVSAAIFMREGQPLLIAVLIAIGVGGLCGFLNGLVTTKARMPSFIVTLAMMGLARGLALVISEAQTVFPGSLGLSEAIDHKVLGLQIAVWLLLGVALAIYVVLSKTTFGRGTYAIGSNPTAARLSGIRVDRNLVWIFTVTGVFVGLAGMVEFMQISSAQPVMGQLKELDAIAAVVIGGASLNGGQGSVGGTLIGVAIMAVLHNGSNLLGIPNEWEKVVIGPLIVLAVLYDRWLKGRRD
jgi:ribose transport system permease protein